MPVPPGYDPPPLSWWAISWRYLLAVWAGALAWVMTLVGGGEQVGADMVIPPSVWAPLLLDLAVGAGALVLMAFRRRWPLPVALAVSAATTVSASAVGAWAIVLVSVSTRRRWREISAAAGVSVVAASVYERYVAPEPIDPWQVSFAVTVLSIGLAIVIGLYIGARRELVARLQERADTAEREQAMRMAQARVTERARIAREMHDVIAHRMSLVAMHAGALAYRDDLTREQVQTAAGVVRDAAHEALIELRQVLGVLRAPDASAATGPEPPQPTLGALPALLDEARSTGALVTVEGHLPTDRVVPEALGRSVYRMVQEALTNARKYAPGAPVHVRLDGAPGRGIEVVVGNPVTGDGNRPDAQAAATPGAGLGLTGLAERAVLAGGTFEHSLRDGWFTLRAWLPWPA